MAMEYNTSPISLREAKVMLDGLVVADAVKATIKFTPSGAASSWASGLRPAGGWAARSPERSPGAGPPRS